MKSGSGPVTPIPSSADPSLKVDLLARCLGPISCGSISCPSDVGFKPRIARHVSGQYCRQPTFNPDWPILHHVPQSNLDAIVRQIGWYGRVG